MNPDIQRRVIELAAEEAHMEPANVSPTQHFQHDLNFDSLSAVQFAMQMEDEFEIHVPDEVIAQLHTVQDAIDYVEKELSKAPAK
ncbi:MAG TPA: acyl carrier protein [Tepidisphaeraceae bacterium]|jgi:acyl carrier protein